MIARHRLFLGASGLLFVGGASLALLLFTAGAQPALSPIARPRSILPAPAVTLDVALSRPMFSGDVDPVIADADMAPASLGETPELIGIVGRLPDAAIALVRIGGGTVRTLELGDSVDGWRLTSLAGDAAFFTRGGDRRRISLPPAA